MSKNETIRQKGPRPGARRRLTGLTLGVGLVLLSGGAKAILIDEFASGTGSTQNISRTANGTTSGQVGSNLGVIGPGSSLSTPVAGWREVSLQRSGTGSQAVSIAIGSPDSAIIINSGFNAISTVTIRWDGNDSASTLNQIGLRVGGTTPAAHGVDVTDAGAATGVILDLLGIDLNVQAQFSFYSGRSGTTANATGASTHTTFFTGGESGLFYIPFTDFTTLSGFSSPVNWTDIGAIVLRLTGPANWDGGIALVSTGPQPAAIVPEIDTAAGIGAIAVLGSVLALLGERRRRRTV